MSYPICLLIVALFCSIVHALRAIDSELTKGLNHASIRPRCGSVSTFYGQTPQDWVKNDLDGWLNNWINANQAQISANPTGFAGAFGLWAQGNPDWSCRNEGSPSNCDFDPCDNAGLNDKGTEVMEAYMSVKRSIDCIHISSASVKQFHLCCIKQGTTGQ